MAFHLLYRDGRDLTVRPLCDRRAPLEAVVAGSELVSPGGGAWRPAAWRRGSR